MVNRIGWLLALVTFMIGVSGVAGASVATPPCTRSSSSTDVTLCYVGANGSTLATAVTPYTDPHNVSFSTGYALKTLSGMHGLNGTTGWHAFGNDSNCPSSPCTAQSYLNYLAGLSISNPISFSFSGTSGTDWGLYNTSMANSLAPTNDAAYYLSASTGATITMTFGTLDSSYNCTKCISEFSLYWGSVDSWNTIQFMPACGRSSCTPITVTGSDIASLVGTTLQIDPPNTASYVLDFYVPTSPNSPLWQSITITSTSPAFEFDNIQWGTVSSGNCSLGGTCGLTSGAPVATPEPSCLLLLCTGVVGVADAVRRRLRA
jgi:hypothetical protein